MAESVAAYLGIGKKPAKPIEQDQQALGDFLQSMPAQKMRLPGRG